MYYPTRSLSRAFTLVELLVAISITALIVVLLGRVLSGTAAQWQASDQRIDSFRDARAALQIMARDLSQADLTADAQALTLSDLDPSGNYAREAFALTSTPNSGKSNLCTVGYYSTWDANTKTFTLKRLFRDSDETVLSLAQSPAAFATLFTKGPPANVEDLAAYIWDLRFAPGTLAVIETPTTNPSTKWQWVEVRFKSMSPNAARKLRNLPISQNTWDDPTSTTYKNLILPAEQQFVTRIQLLQAP
ncbi:MAG: PulJ/GspJ family protein [Chthoniobacterales bacterium]